MKFIFIISFLVFVSSTSHAMDDYLGEQQQLIQQQSVYVIEDILFEMEYINEKIKNNTASDYDKFKLKKLKDRLTNIQNGK